MLTSTNRLRSILTRLTTRARARGWSDAEWARHAGVPKETLCRLRSRESCDFRTLDVLAWAVDATLDCVVPRKPRTPDGLWPLAIDEAHEDALIALLNDPAIEEPRWRSLGPPFFMAGIARTLAERDGALGAIWLALAESLHPGIAEPSVYARWLAHTPWSPDRWLARVRARAGGAAPDATAGA